MSETNEIQIYLLTKDIIGAKDLLGSINDLLEVLSPGIEKIDSTRLDELLANPLFEIYLLELEGEIAGMASLHYMETLAKKSAWVEDVVVHPKHQGKGLGKKITQHIIEKAKRRGVKHVDLSSSPHRVAANRLYQKLKFEPRDTNVYRLKIKK
jgi:GNAT superfamily N-acetyltransferase